MKQSLTCYFKPGERRRNILLNYWLHIVDTRQECYQPFCIQRALLTSGQNSHECCWARKASTQNEEVPIALHVTPDAKLFAETPERYLKEVTTCSVNVCLLCSWRQNHLQAAVFLKHVAPHVLNTPARSKV